MKLRNTALVASSYYVPSTKLSHATLSERFGADVMDRIAQSSGILERRVALNGECASDLAFKAAQDLFVAHSIDPKSIDLVIFATQTPDYLLPTTACILQNLLGVPVQAAAFDINLGCSQYVYSLSVAHAMIASGLKNRALVMTGDTVTRILNPQDRSVVPLFGDAGTASIVEPAAEGEGFVDFVLGSDGSGSEYLMWPTSGMRVARTTETAVVQTDKFGSTRSQDDMFMDGKAIFIFTLKVVPEAVQTLLNRNNMKVDDVDLFIFHQASELIVESSAKKLGIPREKLHYKLHDLGNSGGSTVAIALTDAWKKGRVKPGMNVVLVAFGVGLSWSSTLIRWPKNTLGPVCTVDYSDSPEAPEKQKNV